LKPQLQQRMGNKDSISARQSFRPTERKNYTSTPVRYVGNQQQPQSRPSPTPSYRPSANNQNSDCRALVPRVFNPPANNQSSRATFNPPEAHWQRNRPTSPVRGVIGVKREVAARVIPQFYLTTWILDTSGSMAGGKWRRVQDGVSRIFSQMNDMDFVIALRFSDDVEVICEPNSKEDSDLQKRLPFVKPSGGTALYDSIVQGVVLSIITHRRMPDQIRPFFKPLLVVITDGEDTKSTGKIEDAERVLRDLAESEIEWEILLVGIGLIDEGRRAVQRLDRAGGAHTKFIDIQNNYDQIEEVFQHIALVLQQRTTVVGVIASDDDS